MSNAAAKLEMERLNAEAAQAQARMEAASQQAEQEAERRRQAKLEERKKRQQQRAAASADDNAMLHTELSASVAVAAGETHTFPNGDTYSGEWSAENPKRFHGKGKYTVAATGATYEGTWVNGQRDGKGKYIQPISKLQYSGEWKDNKRHGKGEQVEPSGKFVGVFDNNNFAEGTYIFSPSGAMYKGTFKEDEFHGPNGTYTYAGGDVYVGNFVSGAQEGFGTLTSKSGHKYAGQWHADQKHGKGTYTAPDFSYDGDWSENMMHGQGKYTYDSGDCYEGSWFKDKEHGKGTYTFAAGGSYSGDWVQGRRHGHGKTVGPKGEVYEGEWKEDAKVGYGAFVYTSGAKYEGMWANDTMEGEGVYTFASGKQKIVQCAAGKFTSTVDCTPEEAAALLARLTGGSTAVVVAGASPGRSGGGDAIPEWIQKLPAIDDETKRIFHKEKISERAFSLLTEADLKELGVPLGHRKILIAEIERRGGTQNTLFGRMGNTFTIPTDEASLRKIYEAWDVDGDGKVDKAEFLAAYVKFEKDMGLDLPATALEAAFKGADTNSDAVLSFDEFLVFMLARAKH